MIHDPADILDSVEAVTGETDCYGKQAQELGTVTFDGQAPAGTLEYVTGYTGFNSDPSEQSGYFLPFTINAAEEAEVKMWVSDEGKQVVCDKSPAVNVVFLGATKEIAQKATLKLEKDGQTTEIPMDAVTFNEAAAKKGARKAATKKAGA